MGNMGVAANRASFVLAFDENMKRSAQSGAVYDLAQRCFLGAVKLRASMACASCDNKNSKAFEKSAFVATADVADLQTACVQFFAFGKNVNSSMTKLMQYVSLVSGDAAAKTHVATLSAMTFADFGACTTAPKARRLQSMVAKPAASGSASVKVTTPTVKPTVKVNVKPAVKVTVPKVTVPKANIKVTVKSSTVAIATAATATSWTAWTAQTRSSAFTSPAFASNECLANAAMKLFTDAVISGQSTATMETMAMKWWKALDTAFKLAGSETVVAAWTSFKGTSINTSATAKVTIKVKAPASAAAKVTVPKVSLKVGASTKR